MKQLDDLSNLSPVCYDLGVFSDNENADIFHGFFGRHGGVSTGVYNSLNCGFSSDDDIGCVRKNLEIVSEVIGVRSEYILTARQLHGKKCLKVTTPWSYLRAPEVDAFVTDIPGMALGILTADCAPVLFYAENNGSPIIGAAHAGWRGALCGVLGATVEGMEELGAKACDIKACIGPCIDKRSYEVGAEFYEKFMDETEENERFFISARKEKHFMFDLAGYCAFKLFNAGLSRIYIKDIDTYFNEEDFFSCRRSLHRNEKDYGRQLSVITINKGFDK